MFAKSHLLGLWLTRIFSVYFINIADTKHFFASFMRAQPNLRWCKYYLFHLFKLHQITFARRHNGHLFGITPHCQRLLCRLYDYCFAWFVEIRHALQRSKVLGMVCQNPAFMLNRLQSVVNFIRKSKCAWVSYCFYCFALPDVLKWNHAACPSTINVFINITITKNIAKNIRTIVSKISRGTKQYACINI